MRTWHRFASCGSGPLLWCGVLLGGCTVGPDYEAPQTGMPAGYDLPKLDPGAVQATITTDEAAVAHWWDSFGDDQLGTLVRRAADANLDLAAAEARIRQARATRAIVAGGLWPTVGVSASATRGKLDGAPSRANYQAGLDASWEIDVFGGIRRDVEAADAEVQAAVESRRDVLVTLTSEVALNYIALRGVQERLQVAHNNLTAQQRSVDITRRKFEGGLTSRLDVVNAQAQVAATESQIPSLQAATQQAIYNIGVLLGVDPTALQGELETVVPIPQAPSTIPVGLPSDLLRRRPDVRLSEADLHAATARVGVATADFFPRFSLTGALGFQNNEPSGLFGAAQRAWSIGPGLTWPIFAGGAIRANVERSEAVVDEAMFRYRAVILTALRDVDDALQSFGREQERIAALSRAVDADRQALDLSTRLYAEGQTEFVSVLDAQRSLLLAEDQRAQSQTALATDLVALFKALGGGWESFEKQ